VRSREKFTRYLLYTAVLVLLFAAMSCSTPGKASAGPAEGKPSGSTEPVYFGYGEGPGSIEAIQNAKKDAVQTAAADLLGRAAANGQKEELAYFFNSINDIEPYVIAGSQETVESRNDDGFYYHLGVRVNLEVLASKLKSSDILGGQIDGKEGNIYRLSDQDSPEKPVSAAEISTPPQKAEVAEVEEPAPAAEALPKASVEELKIISEYLDSLTYMVYFNEETEADPFLTRTAVISANRYLDKEGAEYVDLTQIERIKEDQQLVYEEETGEAVSIVQWIAHKLNADVYIELSLSTSTKTEGSKYYGSANVSLNSFNASTAEGLGSAVYQTIPPAFSRISEKDALTNAVSSAVYNGMKAAVAKAENEAAKAAAKGFKYSLSLMNTSDSKMMRDFEKKLERKVQAIKRVSYSPEESTFEVYLIGDIADLEDLIYDTVESVPGMEGIMLVMQRGNSITFDTGM